MANAYRQLGNDEEALVGYQRFMQLDPSNAQIRYEAAQILIDRGRLAEARAQLEQALKLQPSMAAARNALGVVALKNGDAAAAEREIRSAIALKADARLAHFNLALLAEQRGDLSTGGCRVQTRARAVSGKLQGPVQSRDGSTGRSAMCQPSSRRTGRRLKSTRASPKGHLFLAKLYVDQNQTLDEAASARTQGPRARSVIGARAARALRDRRRVRARRTHGRVAAPGRTRSRPRRPPEAEGWSRSARDALTARGLRFRVGPRTLLGLHPPASSLQPSGVRPVTLPP